jgi:hypothetical protein
MSPFASILAAVALLYVARFLWRAQQAEDAAWSIEDEQAYADLVAEERES